MPKGMAVQIATTIDMIASWIETRERVASVSSTSRPVHSETPRSPWNTPVTQSTYCSGKLLSSPSSARISSTSSWVR